MLTDEQKILIMQALKEYKKNVIRRGNNYPVHTEVFKHHYKLAQDISEIEATL